jgi:hypothetical protein
VGFSVVSTPIRTPTTPRSSTISGAISMTGSSVT